MDTPGLHSTEAGGLPLYHHVPPLGPGVAEAVTALIRTYAARAALADLPPINLEGDRGTSRGRRSRQQSRVATVKCGPYPATGIPSLSTPEREARCISDYQRQGYERVPE